MEELIKKLEQGIEGCKNFNEPMNEASWSYEWGVLITANEAKRIIDALRPLNKVVEDGQACDCAIIDCCKHTKKPGCDKSCKFYTPAT